MIIVLAAAIALVHPAPAASAAVHKWVDSDGITHYSDEIPASVQIPVTQINLPKGPTTKRASRSDEYSIANQWRRMHRERIERDKLALEKARLAAAQRQTSEVVDVEQPRQSRHVLIYPGSRHRKHAHYQTNYRYGHQTRDSNRKRLRGYHRPMIQPGRNSLGYFPHIE